MAELDWTFWKISLGIWVEWKQLGEPREHPNLCNGNLADDILSSLQKRINPRTNCGGEVRSSFCEKWKVIFKRAKFNQRRQEEGKPVNDFVTALYCQLEHCCYGDFRDELIRDRIVMGLQDSTLSEKLQLDPTLMLETATTAARQSKEAAAGYKDWWNTIKHWRNSDQETSGNKSQTYKGKCYMQSQNFNPVSNPRVCGT